MFRRKIKLFGKSIPVTFLLLVLVTAVAVAVFLNIYISTVNISAMPGPDGDLTLTSCTIKGTAPGTIDTAVLAGQNVTITASGLDNSSDIACVFSYTPNNGDHLYTYTLPDPMPAGLSALTSNIVQDAVFLQGVPLAWTIELDFGDLQPAQIMDEFTFSLNFADN